MSDSKRPSNRLWKIVFILNIYVVAIACALSAGLMLALWQCAYGNFLFIFPLFAVLALWVSYYLQKNGEMVAAVIFANIPIFGHLTYIAINFFHPDGCGIWFMVGN